ncbi:EF-P beta-lysylation protein EpmB [uncultured Salinisphaera sp.]|uniref:EF-P beta-lysylation protein EpmB n=1 Tax=uncultured Salinisphaera sp. TaxID=359372 RepID=UPI0032B1B7D6
MSSPHDAASREARSLSYPHPGWQQAMREAITDVDTLCQRLDLPETYRADAHRAATLFGLRVPTGYVDRMRRGDVDDPLLRQVLPLDAETRNVPGFGLDAVGDMASAAGHGLLHKYHGRALLVTTGACAVHCRYCFRRYFDYAGQHAGGSNLRQALEHIAADTSISEVILSGGDPLSLTNERLSLIGTALDEMTHIMRIRLHTRTAVVLPERIDAGLLGWVAARRATVVIVVHVNHANELSPEVTRSLAALKDAGATLLNQAVLLAGVNDDEAALVDLSEALFAAGVLPYYIHLLDRVAGVHHFEVAEPDAVALMQAVAARLPGYLVPKLARELPGEPAKRVIGV